MTTASINNGHTQRKTLSTQIDRLDHILDGLADALNGSVAEAVRQVIGQVVSEAVQAAVTEVLSSPDLLRAALERHAPAEPTPMPPPPPKPTLKSKLASAASVACQKAGELARQIKAQVRQLAAFSCAAGKQAGKLTASAPMILRAVARKVWAYRKPCAVAVGVGVIFGATCYLGGQVFSSIANGLSGAAITLSALTLPIRRLFGHSQPSSA
jgi:flagellar biosynthesis/type III secretory pathway protein FliH